jgi:hypothetical protein
VDGRCAPAPCRRLAIAGLDVLVHRVEPIDAISEFLERFSVRIPETDALDLGCTDRPRETRYGQADCNHATEVHTAFLSIAFPACALVAVRKLPQDDQNVKIKSLQTTPIDRRI